MRPVLAAVLGVVVAVVGALIGGDYEPAGTSLVLAGAGLGFVVAEVVAAVGGRRDLPVVAFVVVVSAAAAAWMAWIASGRGVVPLGSTAWLTPGAAALLGGLAVWSGGRRPARGPAADEEAEAGDGTGGPP